MNRIIIIIFINILFFPSFAQAAFADISANEQYNVEVPKVIERHDPVGVVDESKTYGLPDDFNETDLTFGRLVAGSYNGSNWELTTNKPIGISLSYNTSGSISVTLSPIVSDEGYTLPDVRMYPTKIIFGNGKGNGNGNGNGIGKGVTQRIFKFYPIVRVDANTPYDVIYKGIIEITILEL